MIGNEPSVSIILSIKNMQMESTKAFLMNIMRVKSIRINPIVPDLFIYTIVKVFIELSIMIRA